MNTFDPIDLVFLVEAYVHFEGGIIALDNSHYTAQTFVDVAEMLDELWKEIPTGTYAGVWAYDVAEPIGAWMAANPKATFGEIRAEAKRLVAIEVEPRT